MARRFQFSIRFLLLATAVVAGGLAASRLKPSRNSVLIVDGLTILYATTAIVGAVQQTGKTRSFWIGTSIILGPAAALAVYVVSANLSNFASGSENWASPPAQWPIWCVAPVNGVIAIFFHWLFAPSRKPTG